MKILLLKPFNISDNIQVSLGLGYLATAVRECSEVEILDCIKEDVNLSKIGGRVRKIGPDIIGIQCYTYDLQIVKQTLNIIKGINKNIVTVIGGPHPSAEPKESMEYFGKDLDFVFVGEAEKGFRLLAERLQGNKAIDFHVIPGLVWRENAKIRVNASVFEEDLDSLGIPAWDLIKPQTYPEAQHGAFYKKFPIAPIMLTRGCPFMCAFCASKVISGKKLRKRGVANVIKEIRLLCDVYGIREFHIVDDNFTLDKEYAKEFLNELEKLSLDISWAVPNGIRMENLDPEFLSQMKRTGLYLVSLGIESGSDRVLALMKKSLKVEQIRKAVRMINDAGLDVAGFFILGFPGERREDLEQTIKFSLELDLRRANFSTYLPLPGTENYLRLKDNAGLKTFKWGRFHFSKISHLLAETNHKELKALKKKAFLRFYLRPSILLKNLSDIKSPRHFKFLFRRFINWMLRN